MADFGKWLGGALGWVLSGPIGGVIGFAIGSIFDNATLEPNSGAKGSGFENSGTQTQTAAGDFNISLLVLCAAVMKADGRVVVGELEYVKAFFKRHYGEERAKQFLLLLRDTLKKDFSARQVCLQIKQYMDHASRLQLLHLLYGVANADGSIDQRELTEIENIAGWLGISEADSMSLRAMYYKDVTHAYEVLELTENATDEEIKKAYRKLVVKYHPDKVSHLGEEMQAAANEKFQRMQAAYETIKKQRGII